MIRPAGSQSTIRAAFAAFDLAPGMLADLRDDDFPTAVLAFNSGPLELPDDADATSFGFVLEGPATLEADAGRFTLASGMYFAVPGGGAISGPGRGLIIARFGHRGLFQIGGPVEESGRLRYIDGCSDTLLIAPPLRGDPCLNLLHLPPGTDQTEHTHPSLRAGLIVRGSGHCVTSEGSTPLRPGLGFVIPSGAAHSFKTDAEALTVIAYHPDSDFGPTHDDHPMINRTIIAGTPAGGPLGRRPEAREPSR